MLGLAKKIFGSSNDRKVKTMLGRAQAINALEPKISAHQGLQLKDRAGSSAIRCSWVAGTSPAMTDLG